MKKKLILTIFLGLNLPGLVNCAPDNTGLGNFGYLRTTVQFPDKKFTLKVIPESTKTLLVKVTGTGLDIPLRFDLTKENNTHIFTNVPQGDKVVSVTAINPDGKTVAEGQNTVNVIPKQLNSVEVNLREVNLIEGSPLPSAVPGSSVPTVVPSGTVPSGRECVVIISPIDFPLSQSLEDSIRKAGCRIKFPDLVTPVPSDSVLPNPLQPVPTSSPLSGSGGGTGGGGNNSSDPGPSINLNLHDGSPVPNTTTTLK